MAKVLLASGGPTYAHDHRACAETISDILTQAGHTVAATTRHFDEFPAALERTAPDVVVVHALWWRMLADRYDDLRQDWAYSTTGDLRASLATHVTSGGGLVALHTATICFDDWSGWGDLVGGQWNWERSFHPPLGEAAVRIANPAHAMTHGLTDFITIDEIYANLDLRPGIEPLAFGLHADGSEHPILWARTVGQGRVAQFGLGHNPTALQHPTTAEILRRCVAWTL